MVSYKETLPISISSLFHGFSVLLSKQLFINFSTKKHFKLTQKTSKVIFFLILASGGLFYVSQHQIYPGSGNNCLGKNTVAMYGQDNFLYCPNTLLVSNLNITDTSLGVSVQTVLGVNEESFSIVDTQTLNETESIRIDYSGKTYWYFNMNPNSSVSMSFTEITSESLTLSVDDDDLMDIPLGSSSSLVSAKNKYGSRGHRIQIKSSNITDADTYVGYVAFQFTQTSFGRYDKANQYTCNKGFNCVWNFDFAEDVCLLIFYPDQRIWDAENSGHCLIMIQAGNEKEWSFFLITVSALCIFLIVFVNGFIAYLRGENEKERDQIIRRSINDQL